MIDDAKIIEMAINCRAYNIDGKEFRFYHGCELIKFAKQMYDLGKRDGKRELFHTGHHVPHIEDWLPTCEAVRLDAAGGQSERAES